MFLLITILFVGCKDDVKDTSKNWECVITEESPEYSQEIGCFTDFETLGSDPLDASIPGAISVKTVVDRVDEGELYFQNSKLYQIHWEFAQANLSGNGLPIVPDLGTFNTTEYFSTSRRFLLGAVTYYEEPDVWVYELSPYDSADAEMIADAYYKIAKNSYFGNELYFHPTSTSIETEAEKLPNDVKVITTNELFEGITYQPLNLATSMGQLNFYSEDELENAVLSYQEIVVLDFVPNDISIVSGIITSTFQTPLSHINVLSQNRGTPNMALIGAFEDEGLMDLEGAWVELTVEAMDWRIREVTMEEADEWWEQNKPEPLIVTPMDTSVTELVDAEDILDVEGLGLQDALLKAIPAFGGKGSHYGGLSLIDDLPVPKAFVIPVYFYNQFMTENDLWSVVETMLADTEFQSSATVRDEKLKELREKIKSGVVNQSVVDAVSEKLRTEYGIRCRFRSSTNAEDVNGFNGAGLYTSKSGDPDDPDYPVEDAMREVWASVWSYRAYDEREYYSINHTDIGMALLVHRSFPDELANGVAITANIYDTSGMEPAFYINVQEGEESVVKPDPGVTTDQFLYYYSMPSQPTVFINHSNLIEEGETVLTRTETYSLGSALDKIHKYYYEVYGTTGDFYGMDVEFKFDDLDSDGNTELYVKQARPYPGWGS